VNTTGWLKGQRVYCMAVEGAGQSAVVLDLLSCRW